MTLSPDLVLSAFKSAQNVTIYEAAQMYRAAGLRPVPLDSYKKPLVKEFALHDHALAVFQEQRVKGIGLATGDNGAGLCGFDHDDEVYRDAFLSLVPETLGVGRAGELRKSIIIISDGCPDAKRCAPPPSASVDIAKGEFGYFKAGKGETQHQIVVPPGRWHGSDGETQELELVVDEEPLVMTCEQAKQLVREVHQRVCAHYSIAFAEPWQERAEPAAIKPVQASTAVYTAAQAAIRRLAMKMRDCTEEGNGRTDMLWRYACIASTYARAGAVDDSEAKAILRDAARSWGAGHTDARIEEQLTRAWASEPSRSAQDDLRRWERGRAVAARKVPSALPRRFTEIARPAAGGMLQGKSDAHIGDYLLSCWGTAASTGTHLYIYDEEAGVWVAGDHAELTGAAIRCSGMLVDTPKGPHPITVPYKLADTVARYVKSHPDVYDSRWLVDAADGVAVRNGWLTPQLELRPHSPAHRALYRIEIDYDPHAKSAALQKFFADIFDGDDDARQKVALLQEFAGLALLGMVPRTQKALVLHGTGGNGKGRLIEILRGIFPPEMRTAVAPHDFVNPYYRTTLIGSRINMVDEMPSAKLQRTDVLKAMISGDMLQAEAKYHMPVTFRPTAAHLFAVNSLPPAEDITPGFFRRFEIISFNRAMDKLPTADRDVDKKVLKERTGILAWAMEGARRYMQTGRYTHVPSSAEIIQRWRESSDSVADFASERLTAVEEGGLSNRDLYREYLKFCSANGLEPKDIRTMGRTLRILGHQPTRGREGRGFQVLLKGYTAFQ